MSLDHDKLGKRGSDRERCETCGVLNENFKDWDNPAVERIYKALAVADRLEDGNQICDWLNRNGFANLTCCPKCHTDDFTHVEGCAIDRSIASKIRELYT